MDNVVDQLFNSAYHLEHHNLYANNQHNAHQLYPDPSQQPPSPDIGAIHLMNAQQQHHDIYQPPPYPHPHSHHSPPTHPTPGASGSDGTPHDDDYLLSHAVPADHEHTRLGDAIGESVAHPDVLYDGDAPIDEEPLYVNAKQYYRILKRRVARARLEELHRLSRQRKPYLHESRHKHAMRRPRGPGGRFLTAEEIAAQKAAQATDGAGPSNSAPEKDDMDHDYPPHDDAGDHLKANTQQHQIYTQPQPQMDLMHASYHAQERTAEPVPVNLAIAERGGAQTAADIPLRSPYAHQPQLFVTPPQAPAHHAQGQSAQQLQSHQPQQPAEPASPMQQQMHHVPHPHAHAHARARARAENRNLAGTAGGHGVGVHAGGAMPLSPSPSSSQAQADLQRRTEEIIQFSARGMGGL